jgi:hypothetical protein
MAHNNSLINRTIKASRGWFCLSFFILFFLPAEVTGQTYYGLFPSSGCSDNMKEMKTKDESNVIQWTCDESVNTNSTIWLRNADSKLNLYNQSVMELSNTVAIPCLTPTRDFKLKSPTSFKEMGLSTCDTLNRLNIWLTFKPSGMPDTLFVGVRPGPNHLFLFPTPHITFHSNKINTSGFFAKGSALSFEAEPPANINSDLLEWEWYVDGVKMTGRSDRWFETYSRTQWKDGSHTISCRYKKRDGQKYSPMGNIEIRQLTTKDKTIKAFPYWGADCADEEDLDSTNFCYNEKAKWGSFTIHPLEEYVHFYLEVLNEDIESSTITNDPSIRNFELLDAGDAGSEYTFFNLPTNCKAHAKEPYSPATIYFKIDGKNINYSLRPYITPSVKVSPDSVAICENSFEISSDQSVFTANGTGFVDGTCRYEWYYSRTKDGHYQLAPETQGVHFVPAHTGFYKVKATDGVFSAFSSPVKVNQNTEHCISADIYTKEGKNYTCVNGSLEMHTSLVSPGYTYQWKIGNMDGSNLQNIDGATGDMFYGNVNKPGEGYFIEVHYGSRSVLSHPFHIRALSRLNPISAHKLAAEAIPTEVCMDYNVTLHAHVNGKNDDTLPLIYNFYQASILKPILLGSIESANENIYFPTPVHNTGSTYYIVAVGCDQQLRSDKENMTVALRNDVNCANGNFYVKKTGNDYNDGTSWMNAFASVEHAIMTIRDLRKSMLYANTHINLHIAAGEYSPEKSQGFEFPDNVTIYGGYDELPTDNSLSGTMRNPVSPANKNGYATIFRSDSASQRIVNLVDEDNVKFVGIHFVGDQLTTNTDGRAIYVNGSNVTLDSCWISGFRAAASAPYPIAAVSFAKDKASTHINIDKQINIRHSTFSNNQGGEWGCCLNLLTDGAINIENSTFSHNTNDFKGGTAILSYDASPKVNIINSTFYDNTIVNAGGSFGCSVMRMAGGNPIFNIICSTVCGHLYKENGTLSIYHSIVECAGYADNYSNNFPKESPFVEESKDNEYNPRMFTANFKGSPFDKITTVPNCITQVLIPSNKLEIVSQAGAPYTQCILDQRGVRRNEIASTFGAYDNDYAVAIEQSSATECIKQSTFTSFRSAVSGLTDVKYQWVNNYSDVENGKTSTLKNVGIGTYWLEITGKDANDVPISLRSNEIQISDICETPGEFFVKAKVGNDSFAGTDWNKALATLDQALQLAKTFCEKNAGAQVTINVAAGTYTPNSASGFRLDKYAKELSHITIIGGYPENATKQDGTNPKGNSKSDGNETIFMPLNNKGRIFDLSEKVKGLRIRGIHFKGKPKMVVGGCALNMNGAEVELDSCWINEFSDASINQSGNNAAISINSKSRLTLRHCHFSYNNGRRSACIGISGSGNESSILISNSTFNNNTSANTGGVAILVEDEAKPSINILNSTFYSNRCQNSQYNACSVIRLAGNEGTSVKMYNTTLMGTCFNEKGSMELYNSLIEATGPNVLNSSSYIAYQGLTSNTDDVAISNHRKFADAFKYILSYDCGFSPVLRLKNGADADLDKSVNTLGIIEGVDLSTDECGKVRGAQSNMGAVESE